VAVTVTDPAGKPKAIVIGDYSIISDDVLLEMASGSEVTNNYEFFRSGLEWLSDRKIIDLAFRQGRPRQFSLSKTT